MMQSMEIRLDPDIPVGKPWVPEQSIPLSKTFWQLHDTNHQEFALSFLIGEEIIQYYPANLEIVISDLLREYDLSMREDDHTVEFSGYTVALAEIENGRIVFRDAGLDQGSLKDFGVVPLASYLSQLRQTIGSAMDYVRSLNL